MNRNLMIIWCPLLSRCLPHSYRHWHWQKATVTFSHFLLPKRQHVEYYQDAAAGVHGWQCNAVLSLRILTHDGHIRASQEHWRKWMGNTLLMCQDVLCRIHISDDAQNWHDKRRRCCRRCCRHVGRSVAMVGKLVRASEKNNSWAFMFRVNVLVRLGALNIHAKLYGGNIGRVFFSPKGSMSRTRCGRVDVVRHKQAGRFMLLVGIFSVGVQAILFLSNRLIWKRLLCKGKHYSELFFVSVQLSTFRAYY